MNICDFRKSDLLGYKKPVIGSWITLKDPGNAEIMADSGFKWIAIDCEHTVLTLENVAELIRVLESRGVVPLVRVSENDPGCIKRVMDAGAYGVIVPMVNNAEDAEKAVSSVKYPPLGKRGVGLARAQGYGMNFGGYKKWVNKNSIVAVQVEHIDAVENLESILNVKGVDAFFVGPYDLSASMGIPGNFTDKKFKAVMKKIKDISGRFPIIPGMHVIEPSHKDLLMAVKKGYKFIAFSLDTLFLARMCNNEMDKFKGGVK